MNPHDIKPISALLKSISHPVRLGILCVLQEEEARVGDLVEQLNTSGGNITQHLNILRNQGVVISRREANVIYNRISDERVIHLMNTLQALFCREGENTHDHRS
ncbi:MAG: transcriptional regulator [Desulfobacterales bacterium]|nr:MAG: transcriptional regulator [Desulfobacterales bacterium]